MFICCTATATYVPLYIFPTHSYLLHIGSEVYTHSTLQKGSRGRATHVKDHATDPVKLRRLTKGASISLPSSPLLPRQADIVPSHSCMKFPGEFNWITIIHIKHSVTMRNWEQQEAMHQGIAAKKAECFHGFALISRDLLCIQLFHTCDSIPSLPPGPGTCDRLSEWMIEQDNLRQATPIR